MITQKTKLGLEVLGAALLLGILGDALLRATPWGINFLLWVSALIAAMTAVGRWSRDTLFQHNRWLALAGAGFASVFAWRDSAALLVFNAVACLAAFSLISVKTRGNSLRLATFGEYLLGALVSIINQIFGPMVLIISDINWRELPLRGHSWGRPAAAIARGLLIACPLLLVFGVLLMAADSAFEQIIQGAFRFNPDQIFTHIFITLLCAWIAGGLLHSAVLRIELANVEEGNSASAPSLGIIEVGIVTGLVNLLFLCFVLVQFRYFFGGAALVQGVGEFTYAEYARRGFFELVAVAALVLPLLLAAHWLLRKESHRDQRVFRALAAAQLALLFVIMASAVARMMLYQTEYGLTELRLYTTAFMAWLALALLWFGYTVLWHNERRRFVCGALIAAFLTLGALNLMNPDALIVRTNLRLAQKNRSFDAVYASALSADAVPALISALPQISPDRRREAATFLLQRWALPHGPDWRTWNRARQAARAAVNAEAFTLQKLAAEVPPGASPESVLR